MTKTEALIWLNQQRFTYDVLRDEIIETCIDFAQALVEDIEFEHGYTPLSEKIPTIEEVGEYVLVCCSKWVNKSPEVKKVFLLDTEIYKNNKDFIYWAKLPDVNF